MKDIEVAPRSVGGNQSQSSVHSLYVLKAMLAFFVVNCHIPLGLPWVHLPGLATDIFFIITGYFLFSADWQDSVKRVKSSIMKVIPIILGFGLNLSSWDFPLMTQDTCGICQPCFMDSCSFGGICACLKEGIFCYYSLLS